VPDTTGVAPDSTSVAPGSADPAPPPSDAGYDHIEQLMTAYTGTPGDLGLIPVGLAEAVIAAEHAELAAADSTTLEEIKREVGYVLHALDPYVMSVGFGVGYGVRAAVREAEPHMALLVQTEGTSENVAFHAMRALASLMNVAPWVDEAVSLGERIRSAASMSEAAPLVARLERLCHSILRGVDADRDGRVSWRAGEGGLRQVSWHMTLMQRGEGLIN